MALNVNEAEASCLLGCSQVAAPGLGVSREAALSLHFGSYSQCFVRCGHTILRRDKSLITSSQTLSASLCRPSAVPQRRPRPAVAPQLSLRPSSSICVPGPRDQVANWSIIHEDRCQFSYSHISCLSLTFFFSK